MHLDLLLSVLRCVLSCFLFFFNDTATTEIYTLSLHDALPIWTRPTTGSAASSPPVPTWLDLSRNFVHGLLQHRVLRDHHALADRKSTRLNSSHLVISYAVFCLKKKR